MNGEDDQSYQRHIKCLKSEWGKRQPNVTFVQQLMNLTYPQRRHWILEQPRAGVDVLELFPCLSSSEQVWSFSIVTASVS